MVNISSVAGRVARNGNDVYCLTKHGVGAFSESLRQELTKRYVRVSLVEPGATTTELAAHNRPEVLENIRNQFGQTMQAEDIADAITYIVTRPRHVAINEMLIRPTEQERSPALARCLKTPGLICPRPLRKRTRPLGQCRTFPAADVTGNAAASGAGGHVGGQAP